MLRPDDFQLYSVQASVFTPDIQRFRKAEVLSRLFPDFAPRYDGEVETGIPQRFTVPPQTEVVLQFSQLKVPLSLTSEDRHWEFKVSSERADSIWVSRPGENPRLADICRQCVEPLMRYPVMEGVQIGRLALVVRRFVNSNDPANGLARHFCQPAFADEDSPLAPLRHSKAFQLHNLKKYAAPNAINVNSWVRLRSDVAIHDHQAASFEQDINTLAEESRDHAFTDHQVVEFFNWAVEEANHILHLYFPQSR